MTKRLMPEERARAVPKLPKVAEEFVQIHLARGARPKAITEIYNDLVQKPVDELLRIVPKASGFLRNQEGRGWDRVAGQSTISLKQVRREYDRMRKWHGGQGILNQNRVRAVGDFRLHDIERNVAQQALHGPPVKAGTSRKLHDLGLARRFGVSHDKLQNMADEMMIDIPIYLDFE